jgi:hypothetical protein
MECHEHSDEEPNEDGFDTTLMLRFAVACADRRIVGTPVLSPMSSLPRNRGSIASALVGEMIVVPATK